LVVAGHYPIYSTGKNTVGDMRSMVEVVYPWLEKFNVDLYLSGHEHHLEYLKYTTSFGTTMDFVISGAAGKPDEHLDAGITSSADSVFAAATGGFAAFEVTQSVMSVTMIDYTGAELFSFTREQSRVPFEGFFDWNAEFGTTTYENAEAEAKRLYNMQKAEAKETVETTNKKTYHLSDFFSYASDANAVMKFSAVFSFLVLSVIIVFLVSTGGDFGGNKMRITVVVSPDAEDGSGSANPTSVKSLTMQQLATAKDGGETNRLPILNLRSMVAGVNAKKCNPLPEVGFASVIPIQQPVLSPVTVPVSVAKDASSSLSTALSLVQPISNNTATEATVVNNTPSAEPSVVPIVVEIGQPSSLLSLTSPTRKSTGIVPSKRTLERKARLEKKFQDLQNLSQIRQQPVLQHRYELQHKLADNVSRHSRVPHRRVGRALALGDDVSELKDETDTVHSRFANIQL